MFYKIGPDKLLLYRTPPDNCLPFKDVLQNRSCQTPFVQNISGQLLLLFTSDKSVPSETTRQEKISDIFLSFSACNK